MEYLKAVFNSYIVPNLYIVVMYVLTGIGISIFMDDLFKGFAIAACYHLFKVTQSFYVYELYGGQQAVVDK